MNETAQRAADSNAAAACPVCDGRALDRILTFRDPRSLADFTLLHCGRCGLRHWSPLVHPQGDYYEDEAQAMYRAIHEGRRDGSVDPRYQRFLRDFGTARGRRLLDVGCSDGSLMALFEARGNQCVGIDIDRRAVQLAQARGRDARVELLDDFAAGSPEKFDFVTMFDVLEHLTDPVGTLRTVRRLLAPNGLLVATVPNRDRAFVNLVNSDFPPHHFLRFDPMSLRACVERADFAVTKIEGFEFGYAGPALVAHFLRTVRGPRRPGGGPSISRTGERDTPMSTRRHVKMRVAGAINRALALASSPFEKAFDRSFKLYLVATARSPRSGGPVSPG